MHEVQGVFCKTVIPWINSQICPVEKNTTWAELAHCWARDWAVAHIGPAGTRGAGLAGKGSWACAAVTQPMLAVNGDQIGQRLALETNWRGAVLVRNR